MKKSLFILIFYLLALNILGEVKNPENLYQQFLKTKNKNYLEDLIIYFENQSTKKTNGYIFYNLGNCYYLLKEYPMAIYYYKKALKFIPYYRDLKVNYEYAKKHLGIKDEKDNLLEYLFFWNNYLPYHYKIFILLVFWNFLWIIMILEFFLKKKKFFLSFLKILSLLVFVLYAVSFGYFYYENFYKNTGIVMKEAVVYKGPNEKYSYTAKLSPGVEVEIKEKNPDWINITYQNVSGWVKKEKIKEL